MIASATNQEVGRLKIYFGHQSVGQNLMDALAGEDSGIRVCELSSLDLFKRPVFAHGRVGQNGDPKSKCRAFADVIKSGVGSVVDVAFFKFCYVDVTGITDVADLLACYRDTMDELVHAFPDVTFLHMTVPLRCVPSGPLGWLRDRLGGGDGGRRDQVARHGLNQGLRRRYAATNRLFDLAAMEATAPNGIPSEFRYRGDAIPLLAPEYTHDGGHLTPEAAGDISRALCGAIHAAVSGRAASGSSG